MDEPTSPLYHTLEEQYQHLGLPTELIAPRSEFTIFNVADLRQPLPFTAPTSRLNFFVFGFVKQAQGQYTIDGQPFRLQPGTVYFTNPGHYRSFAYERLEEAYLITLSESFLTEHVHADVFEEFPFLLTETLPATTVPPALFAEFERLYLQLHAEYVGQSPFRQRLLGHLFVVLLLKLKEHLYRDYNAIYEGNRGSEIVRRFRRALEQHFRALRGGAAAPPFRVADYAAAQHLHPAYLSAVIKSKTGKTVGAWIAERTIAEAKALLRSPLAVKEVAYRLGFAEPAHFSNYFKKHTRRSPAQYRKDALAADA